MIFIFLQKILGQNTKISISTFRNQSPLALINFKDFLFFFQNHKLFLARESCNSGILKFICERYRGRGSPGTRVRILRNPLEPLLSLDFTSYLTKPAGIPKQYWLLKHLHTGSQSLPAALNKGVMLSSRV